MALKTALAVATGILLAGCASRYTPTPLPANFATTKQAKLQAAYHWGVISDSIEKRVVTELKKSPPRPVYIADVKDPTPFQRALAAQLTTSLVNDGYVVSRSPAGSLKVEMDVQAVTFTADRPQYRYHGDKTILAGGVWLLSEVDAGALFNVGAAAGGIDAYQWFNSQFAPGDTPKTEIIVTVSVSDQYRYLARSTSAYYVADTDRQLYGIIDPKPVEPQLTRTFQVRGDM
ncbi:hypothetical protein GJ699_08345 [Duganella sp. FT80W]|uniref:DUF3313 family protein n=1 Tax=Duganella guangzhouensis TaxID=2666084 RepID=A0A6I2L137_9BURK|nr:hypothetical protein [Duganella guangzhouensis]MRW89989.1 hypothetical protein [Duganella guangzhouensis]